MMRLSLPALVGLLFLAGWEGLVRLLQVPLFLLPPPSAIARSLIEDLPSLLDSLLFTLQITLGAFVLASVSEPPDPMV